jgi:hypothetical protein
MVIRQLDRGPSQYQAIKQSLGSPPKQGYSLLQLRDCARSHRLFAECYELTVDRLMELQRYQPDISIVLHLNPGHFVVCGDVRQDRVQLYEASKGFAMCESAEFLSKWSGNSLLNSANEFEINDTQSKSWLFLFSLGVAIVTTCCWEWARWQRRLSMVVIGVFILPLALGCNSDRVKRDLSSNNVETPSLMTVEARELDVGRLQRSRAAYLLPLQIRNHGNELFELDDVQISCSSLSARMSSKSVPANGSASLELLLDRFRNGPKHAVCTIVAAGVTEQVSVSWIISSDVDFHPQSITDVVLSSGQSAKTPIRFEYMDPADERRLSVKAVINPLPSDVGDPLSVRTELSERECLVAFQANSATPKQEVRHWSKLALC